MAIVAGFQGVSESKEITTLGRGGSDTTAVAIAAALKAERCEIYTDVTGVFTADLIPMAAHVDEPWIMGYDLYPMDTLAFKRTFVREAIDGEYVIAFEHDPAIPLGIIREDGGRKRVEPVGEAG